MEELGKYYKVLELDEGASISDIKGAYIRLKKLYTKDSIATLPLFNEFSDDKRKKVLDDIEDAYRKLSDAQKSGRGSKSSRGNEIDKIIANISVFTGSDLANIRQMKGINVKEAAEATKIGSRYLEFIENENFDKLPAEIYVKGFVRTYAEYLQLDAEKVTEDIMNIYKNH